MGRLEVDCFGPIRCRRDGIDVPIRGARQRQLLAALVAAGPDGLSTASILEQVYGEDLPTSRDVAARVLVDRLRTKLGGGVSHDGARYRLDVERVDVWEAQQWVGEPNEFRRLVRVWATPFADAELSPAIRAFSDDLHRCRLRAALVHAPTVVDGDPTLDELLDLHREHPHHEDLAVSIAVALYRCNRQTDALRTLSTTRSELREHFGVAPGSAFEQAELAILSHDVVDAPISDTVISPSMATAGAPSRRFVGRADQRNELRVTVANAARGPGQVVLIEGEAGSGKTELLRRLAADLAPGSTIRFGSASGAAKVGFAPILEAFPGLSVEMFRHEEPQVATLLFCQQVERAIASARPHVGDLAVLLDDLHEADDQTQSVLAYLGRTALPPGVVLALAARPAEPGSSWERVIQDLRQRPITTNIGVQPLDRSDIIDLVSIDHPAEPLQRRVQFAERILELSNGNALAASALSIGTPAGLESDISVVGADVLGPVTHRLASQLSTESLDALGAAATLGLRFTLQHLIDLAELDDNAALDVISRALQAGVITEGAGRDVFQFDHALLAEACEIRLPRARRRRILERSVEDPATDRRKLVRFLREESMHEQIDHTIDQLLTIAAAALADLALAESAEALEGAISMMHEEDPRLLDAVIDLATVTSRLGFDTASSHRRRAAQLSRTFGRPDRLVDIALAGLDGGSQQRGMPDRLELFEAVELEKLEPAVRNRVLVSWAREARINGSPTVAADILQEADEGPMAEMERLLLPVHSPHQPALAAAFGRLAEAMPPGRDRAIVRLRQLWAGLIEMDPAAGTSTFDAVAIEVRQTGTPQTLWELAMLDAALHVAGVRPRGSSPAVALEVGLRLGNPNAAEGWAALMMIEVWLDGDLKKVRSGAGVPADTLGRRAAGAMLAAIAGEETAIAATRSCSEELGWTEAHVDLPAAAAFLAEAAQLTADRAAAAEAVRWLGARTGQAVTIGLAGGYLGPIDRYLALAHSTLGNHEEALSLVERAHQQSDSVGAIAWREMCNATRDRLMKEASR